MTDIFEGGALFAVADARTLSGLLIPWGELSRPNSTGQGAVLFERGTVKLPRDVSIVSANLQHQRHEPVARATSLNDTDKGIVATFSVAQTDEGDQLLKDVAEGKLSKLSAEIKNLVLDGSKAVSGALFGAAFVTEGAFASAALFAIDDAAPVDDNSPAPLEPVDGVLAVEATETPTSVAVTVADSTTTFTPETAAPAAEGEFAMATATIPNGVAPVTPAAAPRTSLQQVAEAMALFSRNGDKSLINALDEKGSELAMFALNDVKITTTGGAGVNILQPQWIGQLWADRTYARKYIPLINHADLSSFKVTGFSWTTKPTMAAWAGDKANVPSGAVATTPFTLTASRYAGGHDIAREFRDFDVPEFWTAYFAAMTDSYAQLTDNDALAALIAGATTVTAGTVPSGQNAATVSLIDGALSIIDVATPTFAIVAKDVYRSLLLQSTQNVIGTLSLALGLEEGSLEGFKIVPSSGIAAGKVLVGSKSAATEYELAGSPIRTEALDQIRGGIDEALFGYAATGINNAAALALVTPAA